MKNQFSMLVALIFVLSSCIYVPESPQENTPSATALSEDPQVASTNSLEIVGGYCHDDDDAFLSVETTPISTEKTSIRLTLDISPPSYSCDSVAAFSGFSYDSLIPQLVTPKGIFIQSGGASSSDRDAEVTASMQSDLSPVEIVEIYNQLLLSSGWKMQDNGNTDNAAWSHWTFTDEQENKWLDQLIVLKASGENDRLLALVRIEKDN
jgi:hypothetical protein